MIPVRDIRGQTASVQRLPVGVAPVVGGRAPFAGGLARPL